MSVISNSIFALALVCGIFFIFCIFVVLWDFLYFKVRLFRSAVDSLEEYLSR